MDGDDKKLSQILEDMLGHAKSREATRNALAQLFPKAEAALRTYVPRHSENRNERKRQHRISERDVAPAYFRLDPQPASWGRSEINSVLDSANPTEALNRVEERVSAAPESDRPRLRRLFLEALDGAFGITRPFNLAWLQALLRFAPSYMAARDEATVFLYTFDNADRIRWIIIHALEGLLPENRATLMLAAIPEAKDISILCDVVRTIARDLHPDGAKDERYSAGFGELTSTVRDALLLRVRSLAKSNEIWAQAEPSNILWFWWSCDLQAEIREFASQAMETEKGVRGLLDAPVSVVHSTEGDYEHVAISSWSRLVNLDELASYAQEIVQINSNESDRKLAERFLKALQRGKERPV